MPSSFIISQTHPQVTVRTTTRPESIQGTLQHSRFTILTCLLCGLPIYRVFQSISLEIQGNESTLLPTDDWMEHDVLKSATGWIQVHKDSIVSVAHNQEVDNMNMSECFFFWTWRSATKRRSRPFRSFCTTLDTCFLTSLGSSSCH